MANRTEKITTKFADAIEPSTIRFEVNDTELKGFILRVSPNGNKNFVLRYRSHGGGRAAPRHVVTIGSHANLSVDKARKEAKNLLAKIELGENPALLRDKERDELTFEKLATIFSEEHIATNIKPRTAKEYKRILNTILLKKFGAKKAKDITKQDMGRLHSELRKTPYIANKMLVIVSSLYSFAERRGLLDEAINPTLKIQKFKEEKREKFLTTNELSSLGSALIEGETIGLLRNKLLQKISPFAAAAIRLLTVTGCRLNEILTLKWEYIDFQRGMIFLPDSKTGKKPVILNAPALAILSEVPRLADNPYVCCGRVTGQHIQDLKVPWQMVKEKAGLEGVRLHDLRHTFASYGAGASLGLPIIGKLLGHTQAQTTARYAHLDSDPLVRASNQIGNTIAAAMNGGKTAQIITLKRA